VTGSSAAKLQRARILQITRNLPPLRGGMERLNLHMALELANEFDVAVVGPVGCRAAFPAGIEVVEVSVKPLWRFFSGALLRGLLIARQVRPHIVLAGSGLTAPFAWFAAKLVGAHMVVYVHGLDLIADHVIYRWLWRPFIRRARLCIANSRNTARLAAGMGIPESRIAIVHPGVDMPQPQTRPNDFRARFDLGDRPLLLSVGRLIPRKGLLEFVENALPAIVARFPDVCLLVLGDEAPDLLNSRSEGLGDRIREQAADLGLDRNLRFIGPQDDATLTDAFRSADVHVFPVREIAGDVEGFGMVAVEAAAHGLQTVAFAAGGVPDAVVDGCSGTLIVPGDYVAFSAAVAGLLDKTDARHSTEGCVAVAREFSWENFGTRLRGLLNQMCERSA
jgi:phosphatidyl-myo-inositol dimannoside synthase